MSSQRVEQSDLSARILWHELMLALLVAMQAMDLFWTTGDGVSVVLVYGFGLIALILWLRFTVDFVVPELRMRFGTEADQ